MVMASGPVPGRTVLPVGEWAIRPGRWATTGRVPRRMPTVITFIPLVTDSVAIAASYTLAGFPNPILASAIVVACLLVAGTYRRRLTLSGLDVAPLVTTATAMGAVLASSVVGQRVWLRDILGTVVAVCVAAVLGRFVAYSLARLLRHSLSLRSRAVVVGADAVGQALAERMREEPVYGLEPALIVDDASRLTSLSNCDIPVHPLNHELRNALKEHRINAAVIAFPRIEEETFHTLVTEFEALGYEIFVVPRLWQTCPVSSGMDRIGAVPLMGIRHPMSRNPMRHVKSVAERCIAAVALLLVAPLLAAVALAEKLSHPKAPVLFRQTRVGLNGREFELLKFRSMTPATEAESQTSWTIVGDSRVDGLGRFLRASSVDELPQLWNIVRGDMALIGPRPERPHFVEKFSSSVPGYEARHRVPVGLTGWAAVNGLSGDTSIAERARFDNFYITNWSLWFDIKIVLRTVWVLFVRFRVSQIQESRARRKVAGAVSPAQLADTAVQAPLAIIEAFDGLAVPADPPADRETFMRRGLA